MFSHILSKLRGAQYINYIWLNDFGVLWGLVTGRMEQVTEAISVRKKVLFTILLAGVMCLWSGLMKIAQKSGLANAITKASRDIFKGLFRYTRNHPAIGAIVLSLQQILGS